MTFLSLFSFSFFQMNVHFWWSSWNTTKGPWYKWMGPDFIWPLIIFQHFWFVEIWIIDTLFIKVADDLLVCKWKYRLKHSWVRYEYIKGERETIFITVVLLSSSRFNIFMNKEIKQFLELMRCVSTFMFDARQERHRDVNIISFISNDVEFDVLVKFQHIYMKCKDGSA